MLEWYTNLPLDLQPAVHGFTLLNEPGLGKVAHGSGGGASGIRPGVTPLPGGNASVVAWLAQAVQAYTSTILPYHHHHHRDDVVGEGPQSPQSPLLPPLLYMNLHESAFPVIKGGGGGSASSSMAQMASAAAGMGLANKPWAVFDVHHYFSWGGPVTTPPPHTQSLLVFLPTRGQIARPHHSVLSVVGSRRPLPFYANVRAHIHSDDA